MDKISGVNNSNINNINNKKKLNKTDEFKKLMKDKFNKEVNKSQFKVDEKLNLKKVDLPPEAKKALEITPEIRSEKVARLKKLIKEGKYNIDVNIVAEAMLKKGFKP